MAKEVSYLGIVYEEEHQRLISQLADITSDYEQLISERTFQSDGLVEAILHEEEANIAAGNSTILGLCGESKNSTTVASAAAAAVETGKSKTLGSKKRQMRPPVRNPLPPKAVEIMERWYVTHTNFPYPERVQMAKMADEGGISARQVKSWFTRRRKKTKKSLMEEQKKENLQAGRLPGLVSPVFKRFAPTHHHGDYGSINKRQGNTLSWSPKLTDFPVYSLAGHPTPVRVVPPPQYQSPDGGYYSQSDDDRQDHFPMLPFPEMNVENSEKLAKNMTSAWNLSMLPVVARMHL